MRPFLSPEQRAMLGEAADQAKRAVSEVAKSEAGSRPSPVEMLPLVTLVVGGLAVQEARQWENLPDIQSAQVLEGEAYVETTKEKRWEATSSAAIRITVTDWHGKTVYHLLKGVLEHDSTYRDASKERKAQMINSAIALTRKLNPTLDLDKFSRLVGTEVLFPAEFSWKPRADRVLSEKDGGYGILQDLAEEDGFPIRTGSQEKIYQEALSHAVEISGYTQFFTLDRKGSEDSPTKLAQDATDALYHP